MLRLKSIEAYSFFEPKTGVVRRGFHLGDEVGAERGVGFRALEDEIVEVEDDEVGTDANGYGGVDERFGWKHVVY